MYKSTHEYFHLKKIGSHRCFILVSREFPFRENWDYIFLASNDLLLEPSNSVKMGIYNCTKISERDEFIYIYQTENTSFKLIYIP